MSNGVLGVAVETWDAVASIATAVGVIAAAVGSWFAYGQLKVGRASRLDQSRPYVVVTVEQGRTMMGLVDIVIRNVAAGPAHNVTITVDPPLERAQPTQGGHVPPLAEARYFNEPIPLMPPGYEVIMFFDRMSERCNAQPALPEKYNFTVSYDDGHGNDFQEEKNIVDLGLMHDLLFSEVYNEHHIAQALRDIRTQLKSSPLLAGNIEATVEMLADRREREERERDERREMLRQMRESQVDLEARSKTDTDNGIS